MAINRNHKKNKKRQDTRFVSPFSKDNPLTPESFDAFLTHLIAYNPKTGKRDNIRQG
jgi:hypothetical protein